MHMEEKIRDFEAKMSRETPWLDGSGYLKRKSMGGPIDAKPIEGADYKSGTEVQVNM